MRPSARGASLLDRLLRPGSDTPGAVRVDLCCLFALSLIVFGAGLGLRDPWPADEPRFALIARDMLATGDWLVPRSVGELYAQKPPLYFWLMAASISAPSRSDTGIPATGFWCAARQTPLVWIAATPARRDTTRRRRAL